MQNRAPSSVHRHTTVLENLRSDRKLTDRSTLSSGSQRIFGVQFEVFWKADDWHRPGAAHNVVV